MFPTLSEGYSLSCNSLSMAGIHRCHCPNFEAPPTFCTRWMDFLLFFGLERQVDEYSETVMFNSQVWSKSLFGILIWVFEGLHLLLCFRVIYYSAIWPARNQTSRYYCASQGMSLYSFLAKCSHFQRGFPAPLFITLFCRSLIHSILLPWGNLNYR